jgi:hypothetical protein
MVKDYDDEDAIDSLEKLKQHVPHVVVYKGKLYVDGILTEDWQLTPAERKRYFTEDQNGLENGSNDKRIV